MSVVSLTITVPVAVAFAVKEERRPLVEVEPTSRASKILPLFAFRFKLRRLELLELSMVPLKVMPPDEVRVEFWFKRTLPAKLIPLPPPVVVTKIGALPLEEPN